MEFRSTQHKRSGKRKIQNTGIKYKSLQTMASDPKNLSRTADNATQVSSWKTPCTIIISVLLTIFFCQIESFFKAASVPSTSSLPSLENPVSLNSTMKIFQVVDVLVPGVEDNSTIQTNSLNRRCTQEENRRQENYRRIGCPSDNIMKLIRLGLGDIDNVVDIGANQGYFAADIYGEWNPQIGLTPKSFRENRGKLPGVSVYCGACMDCESGEVEESEGQDEIVNIYAIDGMPTVIQWAKRTIEVFYPELIGKWQWFHMAVSNTSGSIQFSFKDGSERSHISTSESDTTDGGGEIIDVQLTTVDEFLQDQGLKMVDIMKIDTEGNDPRVLFGAKNSFQESRVRVVTFEIIETETGAWRYHSVTEMVDYMFQLGYVCYLISMEVHRITGCWNDIMERSKGWSNAVCASTKSAPKVVEVFDRYSIAFNEPGFKLWGSVFDFPMPFVEEWKRDGGWEMDHSLKAKYKHWIKGINSFRGL